MEGAAHQCRKLLRKELKKIATFEVRKAIRAVKTDASAETLVSDLKHYNPDGLVDEIVQHLLHEFQQGETGDAAGSSLDTFVKTHANSKVNRKLLQHPRFHPAIEQCRAQLRRGKEKEQLKQGKVKKKKAMHKLGRFERRKYLEREAKRKQEWQVEPQTESSESTGDHEQDTVSKPAPAPAPATRKLVPPTKQVKSKPKPNSNRSGTKVPAAAAAISTVATTMVATERLHPSWEAKRKAASTTKSIFEAASQCKKITFD